VDVGLDLCPSTAFRDAVASMLDGLPARTGLGTWMLLRLRDDGGSAVLAVRGHAYGIEVDQELTDAELPLRALVDGRGPRVAADAAGARAYAGATLGGGAPVGALAGVPVLAPDGSVFGCLVGADPARARPELAAELPTIELLGRLLAVLLVQEVERQELQRRFELAELDALTDPLTGVGNRRACDRLLRRTAQVIDSTRRAADVVARLGGDEFGVLAVECDESAAKVLADRLRGALKAAGIRASVGHATRQPSGTLATAWSAADAEMYADKRRLSR
jgi:GGDEF domain-containing protein